MNLRQEQYRLDRNDAQRLIETGEGQYVADNLDKFTNLNQDIALKLIEIDEGCRVTNNL